MRSNLKINSWQFVCDLNSYTKYIHGSICVVSQGAGAIKLVLHNYSISLILWICRLQSKNQEPFSSTTWQNTRNAGQKEQRDEGLGEAVMKRRESVWQWKRKRESFGEFVCLEPLQRLDSNILEEKKKRETSRKRDARNERAYTLWTAEGGTKRGNKWGEERMKACWVQ